MKQTFLRLVTAAAVIVHLAGCGGGGSTGAGGSTTGGTTGSPTMSLTMVDVATQAATTTVSIGSSAEVSAIVLDGAKSPVSGALVSFQVADATLATLKPASGTALTDANGLAKVRVEAASLGSAGATTVSASATVDSATTSTTTTSETATAKLNFSVGAANVALSGMSANLPAGTTSLSPYATTSITVNIGGVPATTVVAINFSSTCAAAGKASITATANSTNGTATATYADLGCAATDTISASVAGTSTTSVLTLPVGAPSAAALQFVSATPTTIVIKGTGVAGLVESSLVTFKLVDNNNQPIANQSVELSLTTRSGGIVLDSTTSGSVFKQTDASGNVTASVSAGSTPTSVWVIAKYTTAAGIKYSTQSVKLTISTGRPAQDRFSLSIGTFNIEGLYEDGIKTTASVIASDRVGNPVPDGTGISFISSGGQIGTASLGVCTTTKGTCNVEFTSASPRPANGRIAITAYAVGEENFNDANGNNAYDSGESFTDLGDIFADSNFDGVWQLGELSVAFANNSFACASSMVASAWAPSRAGTCDGVWGSAHVRQGSIIVLSGNHLNITPGLATGSIGTSCQPVSVDFYAYDENNNPLPAGTKLEVANLPSKGWKASILPSLVPNTAAIGGSRHTVVFTPDNPCTGVLSFDAKISATTPKGIGSIPATTITVQGAPPPPVIVPTAPGAPTIGTATKATATSIDVSFFAPASDGGSAIVAYTATCTSGANVGTVSAAPPALPMKLTVTGLAVAGAYTCKVTATNAINVSAASAASNSVTLP